MNLRESSESTVEGDELAGMEATLRAMQFIPKRLPPEIEIGNLVRKIAEARAGLGRVQGMLTKPRVTTNLLISPFMTKEAVRSSAIEGTVASFEDVLRYEADRETEELVDVDVREVFNYKMALDAALEELKRRAIGENLLKRAHFVLLDSVRGERKRRGQYRTRPVWIGQPGRPVEEASYVPPPASLVPELMKNWEQYINSRTEPEPLVQMAIAHYQFEAVHPFMDGNGRIGRLVIPLFLYERSLQATPVLYVSEYFEQNRAKYIDALRGVDREGDWETWITFFLEAVIVQAERTIQTIIDVEDMYVDLASEVDTMGLDYGRAMLDLIFRSPLFTTRTARNRLSASDPTVYRLLRRFERAGLIREVSSRSRNKVYAFRRLIRLLQ